MCIRERSNVCATGKTRVFRDSAGGIEQFLPDEWTHALSCSAFFKEVPLKLLLTLAALALLATLLPAGAAEAPRKGVFPYAIHTRTLGNGLNVVVIPMSSNGLCAFWSVVRTGSRDEFEPGHTGFAHFFEHMMFRGTER